MARYLSRSEFTQAKRRLTIAQKKGPLPTVLEVQRTIAHWNAEGYAWPDDWARWQRAYDDAYIAVRHSDDDLELPPFDPFLFR